jgi:hypothetical protein
MSTFFSLVLVQCFRTTDHGSNLAPWTGESGKDSNLRQNKPATITFEFDPLSALYQPYSISTFTLVRSMTPEVISPRGPESPGET